MVTATTSWTTHTTSVNEAITTTTQTMTTTTTPTVNDAITQLTTHHHYVYVVYSYRSTHEG